MAKKSTELTEQVKVLADKQREEMKALETEREEALKTEKYDESAKEMKNTYDSFIRVGFTEEQAWTLALEAFRNATRKTLF